MVKKKNEDEIYENLGRPKDSSIPYDKKRKQRKYLVVLGILIVIFLLIFIIKLLVS